MIILGEVAVRFANEIANNSPIILIGHRITEDLNLHSDFISAKYLAQIWYKFP
jgi:hypothetical protein